MIRAQEVPLQRPSMQPITRLYGGLFVLMPPRAWNPFPKEKLNGLCQCY